METIFQAPAQLHHKIRSATQGYWVGNFYTKLMALLYQVKTLGISNRLGDYQRRKLGVFNLLNFFQLITGILIPISGILSNNNFSVKAWLIICLPAMTSAIVLLLNHFERYRSALLTYFLLYPFLTCVVYINGINAGIALQFILFGILSVFFIKDIGYMLFMIGLSMVSYFVLAVVLKEHVYELQKESSFLYLLNHAIAIVFIYCGLYLIKKENHGYQHSILRKNRALHKRNLEIKKQKELVADKAFQLEARQTELTELNAVKNKLFSVVSHDLRSPLYALRNVFQNFTKYDIPPDEIKSTVKEMANDLNYTIGLMENLLEWSKNQMKTDAVRTSEINVSELIHNVVQLLRLQAEAKQVYIESKADEPVIVVADKDMIHLVLRNLVSNAIKFTPNKGKIEIGINDLSSFAEVYVQDSGVGISRDALKKINSNNFYSTKGTASESGTGLGLMLCKEFLVRNGGQMHIESKPGKGSVFSFTLPTA